MLRRNFASLRRHHVAVQAVQFDVILHRVLVVHQARPPPMLDSTAGIALSQGVVCGVAQGLQF
jgi:hypothetical protein